MITFAILAATFFALMAAFTAFFIGRAHHAASNNDAEGGFIVALVVIMIGIIVFGAWSASLVKPTTDPIPPRDRLPIVRCRPDSDPYIPSSSTTPMTKTL